MLKTLYRLECGSVCFILEDMTHVVLVSHTVPCAALDTQSALRSTELEHYGQSEYY